MRPYSKKERLRKLARDASMEKDSFNRQRIIFKLAEESKDEVIGLEKEIDNKY